MRKIKLTRGKFALVDDVDYEWLNKFKWCASNLSNIFYAQCKTVLMHRLILGLKYKDGKQTDHVDGNGLNNQRSNLRICTNQQNGFNQGMQRRLTSSQFKGVDRTKKKWVARIKYNSKLRYLGTFNTEAEAAKAYDAKAKELFGEYARLNF